MHGWGLGHARFVYTQLTRLLTRLLTRQLTRLLTRQLTQFNHSTTHSTTTPVGSPTNQFDALDLDGNGVLTPDELYPVVQDLLQSQVSEHQWAPISPEDCEKLALALDTDGDGVISNFEFQQFCQVLK